MADQKARLVIAHTLAFGGTGDEEVVDADIHISYLPDDIDSGYITILMSPDIADKFPQDVVRSRTDGPYTMINFTKGLDPVEIIREHLSDEYDIIIHGEG